MRLDLTLQFNFSPTYDDSITTEAQPMLLNYGQAPLTQICRLYHISRDVFISEIRFGCRESLFTHLGLRSVGIDALSSVAHTQLGHLIKRLVLFNI